MNPARNLLFLLVMLLTLSLTGRSTAWFTIAQAQTSDTKFTYQGQLVLLGEPIPGGNCDFELSLFDADEAGELEAGPISIPNVDVNGGVFTVEPDFGIKPFLTTEERWLETTVFCRSTEPGVPETPITLGRIQVAKVPSALTARWDGLIGIPDEFADGIDDNTIYQEGYGLMLDSGMFHVVTSTIQTRVSGECPTGSSIRVINEDGTAECETDDVGEIDFRNVQARITDTCPSGSSIRRIDESGEDVTCEDDDDTTYQNGRHLELVGTRFDVELGANGEDVGIGTTSPDQKLHVVGGRIRLENGGRILDLRADGNEVDIQTETSDLFLRSKGTGHDVIINPDSTDGKVAIGRSNPAASLHIRGSGNTNGTHGLLVENGDGDQILTVRDDGSIVIAEPPFSAAKHICALQILPSLPYILSDCLSAAEYIPTIDNGNGYPGAGDLVSFLPDTETPYDDRRAPFVVAKASSQNDPNLIGFLLKPELGADGEKLNEHYKPLAIYGYFPVKVTMQNGPINRGDPITSSSKPGYGMKAVEPGRIVGYALEDADEEGLIQIMAQSGDYLGNAPTRLKSLEEEVLDLQAANKILQGQLETLITRVTALESQTSE